jgi:hypothetical protein
VLVDELARRVARLGIGNRVEIVDRKVDVGDSTRLPARDRIHISTSHRFFDQNNTIGF